MPGQLRRILGSEPLLVSVDVGASSMKLVSKTVEQCAAYFMSSPQELQNLKLGLRLTGEPSLKKAVMGEIFLNVLVARSQTLQPHVSYSLFSREPESSTNLIHMQLASALRFWLKQVDTLKKVDVDPIGASAKLDRAQGEINPVSDPYLNQAKATLPQFTPTAKALVQSSSLKSAEWALLAAMEFKSRSGRGPRSQNWATP